MKIGLGSAQFGFEYGISNQGGQTSGEEVGRILAFASSIGIRTIDTAPAYGESELVLGRHLDTSNRFQIVTKTRVLQGPESGDVRRQIRETFRESLNRMRVPRVHGLLVHHAKDLLAADGPDLFAEMADLKAEGLVEKIGVSVYDAADIDRVLSRFPIDIIQVPFNVFDQRLLQSGHLGRLKQAGVEIHARSVFLQGLLLMEPEDLTPGMDTARAPLENYRRAGASKGLSPLAMALGLPLSLPEIHTVLCGVNTLAQLQEIAQAAASPVLGMEWSEFASSEESILNPSRWRE